uniref:Uncharacterized protein n=1 Tax=Panagrolaimus superbus TaxID=310955 RepID=A0A914XWP5_9BILA
MRYLLRSFKYQISTIKFNQCEFLITADKLARLINPWKPKSLEFCNCSWNLISEEIETNFDQLFIDFFFSRHQNLDSLIIDFSKMSQQKLEITDKIAQIFNDSTKLPSNLIFKNCLTNITAKTLHNAIWVY